MRGLTTIVIRWGFGLLVGSLALAACADETTSSPTDTDVADTARPDVVTPWILPEDTTDEVVELAASDRATAIQAGLELAQELDPEVVLALHDTLFPPPEVGSGDLTGCPATLTYDYGQATAFFWQGECTDAMGTRYSGTGTIARYDDFPGEGGPVDGFELSLAGRIEAADGTWLEGAGRAGAYAGGSSELQAVAMVLEGTFQAGGPRAPDDPWLDGSRKPSLDVRGWVYVPTGGRSLTVVGALAGNDLFPETVTGVSFDGITIRQVLAGATCDREAGGAASVRAVDGTWYDVLFDGPTDDAAETAPELCDGCGDTYHRGQAVDPTCVDARPILGATP